MDLNWWICSAYYAHSIRGKTEVKLMPLKNHELDVIGRAVVGPTSGTFASATPLSESFDVLLICWQRIDNVLSTPFRRINTKTHWQTIANAWWKPGQHMTNFKNLFKPCWHCIVNTLTNHCQHADKGLSMCWQCTGWPLKRFAENGLT